MLWQLLLTPEVFNLGDGSSDASDVSAAGVYFHSRGRLELAQDFSCEDLFVTLTADSQGVMRTMVETHRFEGYRQDEYLIHSTLHAI